MTHEIQHLMQQLRLPGMRAAYEGIVSTKNMQSIDNDELLNLLLQAEWDERENLKASRRLQNAKFRMRASIEEIDFHDYSLFKQFNESIIQLSAQLIELSTDVILFSQA